MIKRPTVAEAYDRFAAQYDVIYSGKVVEAENRAIRERLGGIADPVLDVGCGTGLLVDLIRPDPESYIGIDISEGMLQHARRKYSGYLFARRDMNEIRSILQRVPKQLTVPVFSTVVSLFGAYSYADDPEDVAQQIHKVLHPGGRLFLMACGHPHRDRPSAIENVMPEAAPTRYYTARDLYQLFGMFNEVSVSGFTSPLTDRMPSFSVSVLSTLINLESLFVSPDKSYYLIVDATK